MAAGRPAVALNAPGCREVLLDGENGRLLPENVSEEDFASTIETLVQQPRLTAEWGRCARRTAEDFSRDACAGKMEKLYREALSDRDRDFSHNSVELGPLEALAERIRTEWDLWRLRTEAVVEAVQADLEQPSRGDGETKADTRP
jgi:hypothetical protein